MQKKIINLLFNNIDIIFVDETSYNMNISPKYG